MGGRVTSGMRSKWFAGDWLGRATGGRGLDWISAVIHVKPEQGMVFSVFGADIM